MRSLDYFKSRARVDEATGCWEWQLARTVKGYGLFQDGRLTRRAHRGAWEAVNGQVPDDAHVLHSCDNPQCVNPEHLFLGTNADNVGDKVSKGRQSQAKGSLNGRAKLSEHDVGVIKVLLDLGVQGRRLATLYNASEQAVSFIKTRRSWAHVAPLVQPAVAEVTR